MAVQTSEAVQRLIIGGERVDAASGRTLETRDPSTGQVLTRIASGGKEDVDRAVTSAQEALEAPSWRKLHPRERGRILMRMAAIMRERGEELAVLECHDTGKPLRQARADVDAASRYFEYFAGVADKILGETIPIGHGYVDFTLREPIGVSGHIVPWNYPLQIASRGVAPALAVGCTVVIKPSSEAPLTPLLIGEIGLAAGLPPGVLNVVTGPGGEAGVALAGHPGVNQITFTGSVEIGIDVAQRAAANVVPVVMELGGKSPNIVFADADMDFTIPGVANAIFQNSGQTCSAGSRLLVERSAHREVVERLRAKARSMRVGPGLEDPDMGPVISERQRDRVEDYIRVGRDEGAVVASGGKRPDDARLRDGYFLEPTILDGVGPNMRVAQEEIFGPVLVVIPFDDLDEAASIANVTQYGLVAGVWTRDISKALTLVERIKAGQVFVNGYAAGGGVEIPFGGYKKSGYGREKGLEALRSYVQVKNVCIKYS
jgi:acyl-CoA reductase-like NAD-dependent aldehyde dehydrogenase